MTHAMPGKLDVTEINGTVWKFGLRESEQVIGGRYIQALENVRRFDRWRGLLEMYCTYLPG